MFDNISLDIFIGLIFIYLLYSLLASIIMEIIARYSRLRANMLVKAIRVMLEDRDPKDLVDKSQMELGLKRLVDLFKTIWCLNQPAKFKETLAKAFYEHPSIKYLGEDEFHSKPSYIEGQNFSSTLISILRGTGYDGTSPVMDEIYKALYPKGTSVESLIAIVETGSAKPVEVMIQRETLLQLRHLYIDSHKDIDRFKALLENWFNETMDRLSGWYIKQTKKILFVIGLTLAIVGNVDSIKIYHILANNNTARELLANRAVQAYQGYGPAVYVFRQKIKEGGTATVAIKDKDTTITFPLNLSTGNETLNTANEKLQADIQEVNKILGLGWHNSKDYKDYDKAKNEISKYQKNADRCVWLENEMVCLQKKLTSASTKPKEVINKKNERLQKQYDSIRIIDKKGMATLETQARVSYNKATDRFWLWSIPGWLITALAITLGAPFWFDLLGKLISMRSTGKKPKEEEEDKASKMSSSSSTGSTVPEPIKVTEKVG